jgi:hypothetical protein
MRAKVLYDEGEGGERTMALVFEKGEEVMAGLRSFVSEHVLTACQFTAIGAFSDVVLGYYDWEMKGYKKIPINEQVEVLVLVGDIAITDGESAIHAHVVVGKSDGTAHGGHLLQAHVRPTLEVMLVDLPNYLRRKMDEETGLALINMEPT